MSPERMQSKKDRENALAEARSKSFFWQNILAGSVRKYGRVVIDKATAETLGKDSLDVRQSDGLVEVRILDRKRSLKERLCAALETLCAPQ